MITDASAAPVVVASADEPIEVGEDTYSDTTSSLGSDTTSVNSSVFEYQYENGRRYHNFRAGNL